MKKMILFSLITFQLSTFAEKTVPYCTAIRGNGELVSAHWSALSRTVENLGMPKAMAGGSSAAISLFFLDSIAGNTIVNRDNTPKSKRLKQALLLKSIPVFLKIAAHLENAPEALNLLGHMKKDKFSTSLDLLTRIQKPKTQQEMKKVFLRYGPLVNPKLLAGLVQHFPFFKREAQKAYQALGTFDPRKDQNIFFRHGLFDFKVFALLIGQIGDFYAGYLDPKAQSLMSDFLDRCHQGAFNKIWPSSEHQTCYMQFQNLVAHHLTQLNKRQLSEVSPRSRRVFEKVGKHIAAFPTTAVVTGKKATSLYSKYLAQYNSANNNLNYADFSISFNDIRYGYWGQNESQLSSIKTKLQQLFPKDLKSQRFLSLGAANWLSVLATSPAEPGLANLQKIMLHPSATQVHHELVNKNFLNRWSGLKYKKQMYSAGGWSDLHPTLVLRAHGCENIVYITRTAGESVFGQQIFIRLMGLEKEIPFWKDLARHNNEGWNNLTASTEATPWHQLYNLANSKSSYSRSVDEADAVYCTDWNRFNAFKGEIDQLIVDAYSAPVILKQGAPSQLAINPLGPYRNKSLRVPGCRI